MPAVLAASVRRTHALGYVLRWGFRQHGRAHLARNRLLLSCDHHNPFADAEQSGLWNWNSLRMRASWPILWDRNERSGLQRRSARCSCWGVARSDFRFEDAHITFCL